MSRYLERLEQLYGPPDVLVRVQDFEQIVGRAQMPRKGVPVALGVGKLCQRQVDAATLEAGLGNATQGTLGRADPVPVRDLPHDL